VNNNYYTFIKVRELQW